MLNIKYDFKENAFFALLRRLRNINRWSLMHNLVVENVAEHSHEVAILAHGIAATGVAKFGRTYCPNKIATIAIYHETSEPVLSDLPSTLKHANSETTAFFRKLEDDVEHNMVATLPDYLQDCLSKVAIHSNLDEIDADIVKAADNMSMLLKCEREIELGNNEFKSAKAKSEMKVNVLKEKYPEVKEFWDLYAKSFKSTIDGLVSL